MMATNKKRKHRKPMRSYAKTSNHWYDKTVSGKQMITIYVIIALVFVLLAFLAILLLGKSTINNQGYESTNALIKGYFTSIKNNDLSNLQRCFDLSSVNGSNDLKTQQSLAQKIKGIMDINTDSVTIDSREYNGDIDDLKRNTQNYNITRAEQSQITFLTTETKSDDKSTLYTRYHIQYFITYCANEKWYIYTNSEKSAMTLEAMNKLGDPTAFSTNDNQLDAAVEAGNDKYGHIKIGSDWSEVKSIIDDELVYENVEGTARISLTLIEDGAYEDVSIFVTVFKQALEESENFKSSVNVKTTRFNNAPAYLVSCIDNQSGQMLFTWIFEDSNKHIRNVSLECISDASDAAAYVSTFSL